MQIAEKLSSKTLGPQSAKLVTELYEQRRNIFSLSDVQKITGLNARTAGNLASRLVDRGVATRLKPGLFILVPFELGHARQYAGNPYLIAREIAPERDYYLSHASAMDIHGMTTQPQLRVFITSTSFQRNQTILGTDFRFVQCKREHFFGITDEWVEKSEQVKVSDIEKTVIDGLRHPRYCGGLTEVAKGLWLKHSEMNIARLVGYAVQMNVGAVIRRLGFLLDLYRIGEPQDLRQLQSQLTDSYDLLDPTLPREGNKTARWRLLINIPTEELLALRAS